MRHPSKDAPPIAFDPTDPHFVADPYPRYAELRASPVPHVTVDGLYVLTRHADVLAALHDPRLSSDPRHAEGPRRAQRERFEGMAAGMGVGDFSIMLVADPPDHTRLRRLANRAFTPRAVESLRPRIAELVADTLDRAEDAGCLEVMGDLAEPLPVTVICELLGVPCADQGQFKPWSTAVTRALDAATDPSVLQGALPAIFSLIQYFAGLIAERRARPGDDLLSALIQAESDGDRLSTPELFAMVILLFIAGHETTTNLIGNGVLALARNPDQFDALRRDPGMATAAVEELLRYDSPVQVTARTATTDVEVGGIRLSKGEGVVCGLAAANRDPDYISQPDRLLLARGAPTHLAFGHGMHHCLGAPLARIEGQEVFRALSSRFPEIGLRSDPVYRDHFVLRGLSSLPISVLK